MGYEMNGFDEGSVINRASLIYVSFDFAVTGVFSYFSFVVLLLSRNCNIS